jgi:hypothetical protein
MVGRPLRYSLLDLLADGVEVLGSLDGHTTTQVKKGLFQRLQEYVVATADKDYMISHAQAQHFPDLFGQGDLSTLSDFVDNHALFSRSSKLQQ